MSELPGVEPQFGSIFRRKKKQPDGTKVELGHRWIKNSAEGEIFRESSKSERYAHAERLLKKRIGEVVTGAFHGPPNGEDHRGTTLG